MKNKKHYKSAKQLLNKPIILIDKSDLIKNKLGIGSQMLYEFNEIDFYIAEPFFIGHRYWHVTGKVKIE